MFGQLIGIAVFRTFIPASTIAFIYFLSGGGDKVLASSASFIFAASQLISQVDGGAPSYIMSINPNPEVNLLRLGMFRYFKSGFIWISMVAGLALPINIFFNLFEWKSLVAIYVLAIALSVYNVATSAFIKNKKWVRGLILVLAVASIQLAANFTFYTLFYPEIQWLIVVYGLVIIIGILPYIGGGESGVIEFGHANKLQYSQVASALVVNKEYLLLYFTSQHIDAALYSVFGRLMYVPMQIIGLYISRLWAGLDNEKSNNKGLMRKEFKSVGLLTVFLVIPFSISAIWFGVTPILVISQLFLVFANASSGVVSAFSSLNPKSIPSMKWFFMGIGGLYMVSFLLYFVGAWYFSIIATAIFLGVYSLKMYRSIGWGGVCR